MNMNSVVNSFVNYKRISWDILNFECVKKIPTKRNQ